MYGLNFTHLSRASYCHSSFTPFNFSRWLFDLKIDAKELHQNQIQFFYRISIKNEDLNYCVVQQTFVAHLFIQCYYSNIKINLGVQRIFEGTR